MSKSSFDPMEMMDGLKQMVEVVKGYESELLAQFPDYPADLIRSAVMQFHEMIMTQAVVGRWEEAAKAIAKVKADVVKQ